MKKINYFFIVIGLIVVFYVQIKSQQSNFILIFGIVVLMFGLYNISRGLTSKKEDSDFIKTEYDEEEE